MSWWICSNRRCARPRNDRAGVTPTGLRFVGVGMATRASAPAFARHPGFRIVACAEPEQGARESFARDYGAMGFPDLSALLAARDVDAVYIASPTQLHAGQVIQALRAGKHVTVEKPMAENLADAEAMVAAAERVVACWSSATRTPSTVPYNGCHPTSSRLRSRQSATDIQPVQAATAVDPAGCYRLRRRRGHRAKGVAGDPSARTYRCPAPCEG